MSLKLNPITGKLDKVVKTTTTLGTPGVDTQVPTEKAVRAAISGAGFSDPMTTRGDIIHKNAAGTTTRLGSGTVGQVLTSDGTDISWAASAGGVDTSGTPVANDFARFTDADTIEGRSYTEVRSDLNVEDGADVTDTANVTAAGALMDSEVDADIKTLVLPASTTISAFGKTLVDDAAAVNARTTLDVDQAGTDNSTDVTIGTANGLSLSTQALSLALADTDTTGALSDTDWDTFNNKVSYPGDQTSIVGITGTKAQFDTAVTDGNITYDGDAPTAHKASHEDGGSDEISIAGLAGTPADLSTHESDTTTHGATGDIVGTTDTQTLTNKTLTSPVLNTGVSGSAISTDGTLAGDSDTEIPTEKAVKTYVDGEVGEAWGSWTPTFANFTKGSATITAKYIQIGKTVHYRLRILLAADSAVGTLPSFTLPVTSIDYGTNATQIGIGSLLDYGTSSYLGMVRWATTSTAVISGINTAGTYATGTGGAITATVPMTWTTNDEMILTGTYEAA